MSDSDYSHNRANSAGDALEDYVKDAFADSFDLSKQDRDEKRSDVFSYLGNAANPPDAMLKESYAIEIKKIESPTAELALNSSYPKDKLYASSTSITKACRECEEWSVKEMLYAVGCVGKTDKQLHSIFFVFGTNYCADKEVYENVKRTVKTAVNGIESLDLGETEELGRVNKVDPLEITYMRVRGMWHIKNPMVVFKDYYTVPSDSTFYLACIIDEEKLAEMDNSNILDTLNEEFDSFSVSNIRIPDPNNPATLKSAKMIFYYESN
jgi:hypothetical protein